MKLPTIFRPMLALLFLTASVSTISAEEAPPQPSRTRALGVAVGATSGIGFAYRFKSS